MLSEFPKATSQKTSVARESLPIRQPPDSTNALETCVSRRGAASAIAQASTHVSCRIRRSKDRTRSDPSRHWISSFLVTFLQACAVAPVLHSPEYSAACHGEFMFMRRWGSDTSRDSASAIGRNRCGLQIPIRQDLALAEVRSSWRAFDEHYSNVGTRVACLQIGCAPE